MYVCIWHTRTQHLGQTKYLAREVRDTARSGDGMEMAGARRTFQSYIDTHKDKSNRDEERKAVISSAPRAHKRLRGVCVCVCVCVCV